MSTTKQMGAKQIDAEQANVEEQLVREHLPLVQYVVSEVAHRVPNHVSRSDLVSAGMLGLAQAARSFDPERASCSTASPPRGSAVRCSTSCAAATGRAARCGRVPAACTPRRKS